MADAAEKTCGECRFWEQHGVSVSGVCHRHPPAFIESNLGAFPWTAIYAWCGDWSAKPKPKDAP